MRNQRHALYEETKGSSERSTKPPPREFVEPKETEQIPIHIKPEIFYVLKALEGLELPRSWQLDPKDIETFSIDRGQTIFSPGDSNDVIIVVIAGELGVFTKVTSVTLIFRPCFLSTWEKLQIDKHHEVNMKDLKCGEYYFSQTSIIEILMVFYMWRKMLPRLLYSGCHPRKQIRLFESAK